MHHHPGAQVQLVQNVRRGLAYLTVGAVLSAQTQGAATKAVAQRGVVEPIQPYQLIQNSVRRRTRQMRPAGDLLELFWPSSLCSAYWLALRP